MNNKTSKGNLFTLFWSCASVSLGTSNVHASSCKSEKNTIEWEKISQIPVKFWLSLITDTK